MINLIFIQQASYRLYLKLLLCLHFVAAGVIFVLPKFIRGNSSSNEKSSLTTVTAKTKTNLTSSSCIDSKLAQNDSNLTATEEAEKDKCEKTVDESSNSSSCSGSNNNINQIGDKNHQRVTDTNYLLKDLINKEVNKIKGETDNISNMLMEKIEAANIEGLIDTAVTGICELKDDLMRMNEPEVYSGNATEGLRKRNIEESTVEAVDIFLKKEIDAIKEANVIPAVLSNGHAK